MQVDVRPGWARSTIASRVDAIAARAIPDLVRPYVLPVVVAVLLVVGVSITVSRVGLLIDWSDTFSGSGEHVVVGCEAEDVRSGDRWVCDGAMIATGSSIDVRADLITAKGAATSRQPFVGEENEVFFDPDDLGTVHPVPYRLNELARLYLSVLPRALLAGGAALWLAGWALTRRVDAADLLVRDRVRLPGRFVWQTRGLQWLMVALASLVLNHLLTTRVIGSLGTF
ncbi:MAG: hypothetical protein AAGA93_00320 [Actinomycetota bacterium]